MNREAVALGTPGLHDLQRSDGRGRRGLIDAGLLRPLADPGSLELVKREAAPGPRNPRDPELLVDAVLGAVR